MRKLWPALACALVLTACTGEDPVLIDNDDGQSQRFDPNAACENEATVVDNASEPEEGVLTGDVDGDEKDDTVYLAPDSDGDAGCRSFLIVVAGDTTYSAPVDPSGSPRSLPEPSLHSVIDFDFDPGSEVVVNLEAGASTQFVGVFKLTDDGIERITIEGRGPGPFAQELGQDSLFPFGGSVGHVEAVDCINPGLIVMSAATPMGSSADRYEVERRFFRLEGTVLVLQPGSNEVHQVDALELDPFPEFRSSPFGLCILNPTL